MFAGSTTGVVGGVLYFVLLATACASDLRTRRIPNWLVLVLLAAGLGFTQVVEPGLPGLTRFVGGLLVGFSLWFPFYLLRMLGAGDVKLFAAGAAWLGARSAAEAALLTAFCGGALALVFMLMGQGLSLTMMRLSHAVHQPRTLKDAPAATRGRSLPYGIAVAAGLLLAALRPGLLL
jgi:prepilin peptidase CpaA